MMKAEKGKRVFCMTEIRQAGITAQEAVRHCMRQARRRGAVRAACAAVAAVLLCGAVLLFWPSGSGTVDLCGTVQQVRVDADGRIAKLSVISKVGDIRYELTIPRTAAVCTIDGERCAPDEITVGSLVVCDFWGDAQESDGIYRATAFGEVKVMPTAVQS